MGFSVEIKDLQERLTAWGYEAANWAAEAAGLKLALNRGSAYMKRFCGAEAAVDAELVDILISLAGAYYLQAKLAFGEDSLAGSGISSVKLGDAAVSFCAASDGDSERALQGFVEETMQRCREALVEFRQLRF